MKKLIKIISLILISCCMAVLFASCSSCGADKPETEHDKIAAAYAKLRDMKKSAVKFTCYLETEDTHIVIFKNDYPAVETSETVDGVTFVHPKIETFDVYREGDFYSLEEAFDLGFITHEDLVTLKNIYNPQ